MDNNVQNVTAVNNNFDFSFLKNESSNKNMIYSPMSIKYTLNMLKEGAVGSTYNEINNVIGNSKLSNCSSIDEYLSLANGLFIRNPYYNYIKLEYKIILKEKYGAEVIQDDFKSIQNVNRWIEDNTFGIIKNMLSDDIVNDPNLLMLILNSLAINMKWDSQFYFRNTKGCIFFFG